MSKCALPSHLREARHSDWIWPLSYIPRGTNAYGPRCPGPTCEVCGGKSFRPWPPILKDGLGVARWETTGATSIICIPEFVKKRVNESVYGGIFDAIEMNPGLKNYGKNFRVKITKEQDSYHPSAIQTFSKKGYLKTDPEFYVSWNYFFRFGGAKTPKGKFYRNGYRPDSLDGYYNKGPYVGLQPE